MVFLFSQGMLKLSCPSSQKLLCLLVKSFTSEAQLLHTGWWLSDGPQVGWGKVFSFIRWAVRNTLDYLIQFSWQVEAVNWCVAVTEHMQLLGTMCKIHLNQAVLTALLQRYYYWWYTHKLDMLASVKTQEKTFSWFKPFF